MVAIGAMQVVDVAFDAVVKVFGVSKMGVSPSDVLFGKEQAVVAG